MIQESIFNANGIQLYNYEYEYDKNGNQIKINSNGEYRYFTYDNLNRVLTDSNDNCKTVYNYDACSNIINKELFYYGNENFMFENNNVQFALHNISKHITLYEYDSENHLINSKEIIENSGIDKLKISSVKSIANVGDEFDFILSGNTLDGVEIPRDFFDSAVWTSSNEMAIEWVDKQGEAAKGIYKGVGNVFIYADFVGYRATFEVRENVPVKIIISSNENYLMLNEPRSLVVSGQMLDGSSIPDSILEGAIWKAQEFAVIDGDNKYFESIIALSSNIGKEINITNQSVTQKYSSIFVTLGTLSTSKQFDCIPSMSTIKSLTISPLNVNIKNGQSVVFTVSGTLYNGQPATNEILNQTTWWMPTSKVKIQSVNANKATVFCTNGTGGELFSVIGSDFINDNESFVEYTGPGIPSGPFTTIKATNGTAQTSAIITYPADPAYPGDPYNSSTSEMIENGLESNISTAIETLQIMEGSLASEELQTSVELSVNSQEKPFPFFGRLTIVTDYYYDLNGNLISRFKSEENNMLSSSETIYAFNCNDQLTKITLPDGSDASYTYYPNGMRATKQYSGISTKFYYDGDKIVNEAQNNFPYATNIYGLQLSIRNTEEDTFYYLFNGHGDVIGINDESGNLLADYTYSIFGETTTNNALIENPYQFSGEYLDSESGLYYLRARYYDPLIARFISEDTYKGILSNPLTLNYYAYCFNNPLSFIDPSGNSPQRWGNIHDSESFRNKYMDEAMELANYYFETSGGENAQSFVISIIPIVGDAKDIQEALTGIDVITGETISFKERGLSLVCAFIPVLSGKGVNEAIDSAGAFYAVINRGGVEATGQLHHLLSNKTMNALNQHPILKGVFERNDAKFLFRAADIDAHKGYQAWHRAVDNEVIDWLESNPNATKGQFKNLLNEIYNRPEIMKLIPGVKID